MKILIKVLLTNRQHDENRQTDAAGVVALASLELVGLLWCVAGGDANMLTGHEHAVLAFDAVDLWEMGVV